MSRQADSPIRSQEDPPWPDSPLRSSLRLSLAAACVALLGVVLAAPAAANHGPAPLQSIGAKCLDVLGADPVDGTPVVYFRCTGNANQDWSFLGSDTTGWLVRGLGNLCLRPGPVGDSGFPEAEIGACDGAARWDRVGSYPTSFQLRHRDTGDCLDVLGSNTDDLTPIVLFDCGGNANQDWSFDVDSTPVVGRSLRSIGDKCLDVLQASSTAGTPVIYFRCTGAANQEWSFEALSATSVYVRGLDGQCLRPGPVGDTGQPEAEIGPCDAETTWTPVGVDAERFLLRHEATDLCLDVFQSSTDDFTPIILFECTGGDNQVWSFDGAGGGGGGGGGGGTGICRPSSTDLCLDQRRFRVNVDWRNFENERGDARVAFYQDDSGVMYFFERDNWELLVKVLDGCPLNDHYWVFFAATTNVEFTLTVTDTETGATRTWFNPLGQQADSITDTRAFATCP